MKYFAGLFCLFAATLPGYLFSQGFKTDYSPIHCTGTVSATMLTSPNIEGFNTAAQEMGFDTKKSASYLRNIHKERNEILLGGFVYYNDEVSRYVNEVLENTLAGEPGMKGKVKLYLTRYASANAISLPEGTIFVNIGLLSALENESQLAAVLAHELAHIKKQHVLINRSKIEKIKQQEENVNNREGNMFRSLALSRDNEFEADALGLSILTATKYNAEEMSKALRLLQFTDTNEAEFDLIKLFNNEYYKIDTAVISPTKVAKWLKKERNSEENATLLGLVEDIYLTHPEIEKRALAVREILKSTNYKNENRINDSRFTEIKEIARFEVLENSLRTGNYIRSAYEAIRLLQSYPNNRFLQLKLMRSLYWMCQLHEQDLLENVLGKSNLIPTKNFAMLNLLIQKSEVGELKKLMYGYTKSQETLLKDNEDYMMQLALSTEAYLGKEASSLFYRQFAANFPNSDYAAFINEKLK